jgi:hypothetical protein
MRSRPASFVTRVGFNPCFGRLEIGRGVTSSGAFAVGWEKPKRCSISSITGCNFAFDCFAVRSFLLYADDEIFVVERAD